MKEAPRSYGVDIGKEAIVGFRQPESKDVLGKGSNIVREGEVRVASHCLAVLGMPSPLQYKWDRLEAAEHIAGLVQGRVVELLEKGKRNVMAKKMKKGKKAASARGGKKRGPGGSVGGFPRKCGECGKRGHNLRSHLPGGKFHKK